MEYGVDLETKTEKRTILGNLEDKSEGLLKTSSSITHELARFDGIVRGESPIAESEEKDSKCYPDNALGRIEKNLDNLTGELEADLRWLNTLLNELNGLPPPKTKPKP